MGTSPTGASLTALLPAAPFRASVSGADAPEGEEMTGTKPDNGSIAAALDRIGALLELQDANPFRAGSYHRGASTVRDLAEPAADLERGELEELPGIGSGLAGTIREYVETGSISLLRRLEAEARPFETLQRIPGVGPKLARRVIRRLGVDSPEELEQAAHDGRLAGVEGFGESRVRAVRNSLAAMLARRPRRGTGGPRPGVGLLLELDSEYRSRAESGELRRIAPRRFNPEGRAWLPVMERSADGWDFTVLFSNTKRAHDLGATDEWVVIYWRGRSSGQCTVVTGSRGKLSGRRVVRGREPECRRHYGLR